MTSNSWLCCFINSKPSPTLTVTFGWSRPFAMNGKYFRDTSKTRPSISTCTTLSTSGCFVTSRATPPSPPPIIRTCERIFFSSRSFANFFYIRLTRDWTKDFFFFNYKIFCKPIQGLIFTENCTVLHTTLPDIQISIF